MRSVMRSLTVLFGWNLRVEQRGSGCKTHSIPSVPDSVMDGLCATDAFAERRAEAQPQSNGGSSFGWISLCHSASVRNQWANSRMMPCQCQCAWRGQRRKHQTWRIRRPDLELARKFITFFFERSANEPTAGLTPRAVRGANDSTILKS